jgi:hypothetical protein
VLIPDGILEFWPEVCFYPSKIRKNFELGLCENPDKFGGDGWALCSNPDMIEAQFYFIFLIFMMAPPKKLQKKLNTW